MALTSSSVLLVLVTKDSETVIDIIYAERKECCAYGVRLVCVCVHAHVCT